MVCTHTLYNEVWAGSLDLSMTELPEAMKRKQHKDSKPREHRKSFGTDISQSLECYHKNRVPMCKGKW